MSATKTVIHEGNYKYYYNSCDKYKRIPPSSNGIKEGVALLITLVGLTLLAAFVIGEGHNLLNGFEKIGDAFRTMGGHIASHSTEYCLGAVGALVVGALLCVASKLWDNRHKRIHADDAPRLMLAENDPRLMRLV